MGVIVGVLAWASRAWAGDPVGAVLDARHHTLALTRQVPSGESTKLQIQVVGSDLTTATLDVWPKLGAADCGTITGTKQVQHLGLTVGGTTEARTLEATIAPLQIDTHYCFRITLQRPATPAELSSLAAAVAGAKVAWEEVCDSPQEARAATTRAVADAIAPMFDVTYDVTGARRLQHNDAATARAAQLAAAIVVQLDFKRECDTLHNGLQARSAAVQAKLAAEPQQQTALAALAHLPAKITAWPVFTTGTPPAAVRLVDLLSPPASVNPLLADLNRIDPDLEHRITAYRDELDDKARAIALADLKAALGKPPAALDFALYVPSLSRLVTAAELAAPGDPRSKFSKDLATWPALFDQQLELLGRQDRQVAGEWRIALGRLVKATLSFAKAQADITVAQNAITDQIKKLPTLIGETTKSANVTRLLDNADVTIGEGLSSPPAVSDDKASRVSPIAGVLVAAPFIRGRNDAGERTKGFATPWITPYLGGSVYWCAVDRVISIEELVGDDRCQRWSLTIGVLASTPSINNKDVHGPWNLTVVPTVGLGMRVTQYLHVDAGLIVFKYANGNPAITAYDWGVAFWVGASLDADVWALIGGKLGK
jgi:hypothetical protein